MNNMLSITLNQVLMMFTFMVMGFFMRKKNIGGSDLEKTLSALLVNIFLPCMTYMCFVDNFHLDVFACNGFFPHVCAKQPSERCVYVQLFDSEYKLYGFSACSRSIRRNGAFLYDDIYDSV